MRCCLQTLDEVATDEANEGDIIPCKWCSSSMFLDGDTWRWNREGPTPA